jgi:hypothetical protein
VFCGPGARLGRAGHTTPSCGSHPLRRRLRLLVDMPKLLSIGAAQQRAATTQTPRRPKGAGGGEERRQVERKVGSSEGLFSLRLPKFESYQPGILNSPAAMLFTLAPPQCHAKSLPQLHVGNAAARTRNCLYCAVSAKSAEISPKHARILIPTDSAVRVLPPQPRSRSRRCAKHAGLDPS